MTLRVPRVELLGAFIPFAFFTFPFAQGCAPRPLHMIETAKATGATTLRIEGTIANSRLYEVLARRYGLTSNGATDAIVIQLKKGGTGG